MTVGPLVGQVVAADVNFYWKTSTIAIRKGDRCLVVGVEDWTCALLTPDGVVVQLEIADVSRWEVVS